MENALVPTPHRIAQSLETIVDMLKSDELDRRSIAKMLIAAASNVRLLFELEADDSGEFKLANYGQAWMLADLLRNGDMVPSSYKTDEQVVIGLMKAMEIGVSPISGLGNIMIINNRPSVWGDLAQALVQRTGAITDHKKEEIGERPAPGLELTKWDPSYGWRVSFYRKGQESPYTAEYTVADAKRAGLWGNTKKLPWITDPSTMLFNRARARALREGFADKLFGMGIIEEQRDFVVDGGELGRAEPARLTSSLTDDEPETAAAAPTMPDYTERAEPPQDATAEPEGPTTAPEPAIDASEPESRPSGDNSTTPTLV